MARTNRQIFHHQLLLDLGGHTADNHPALLAIVWQLYKQLTLVSMDPLMLNVVIGGLLIMFLMAMD